MPRVTGGELLVRMLKQEGINDLFVLHGGHLDAIFQACIDHGLRLIDVRHEQAAGHAADGWARTTGRPGVAIVFLECSPILVIGGAAPLVDAETLPLQGGFDQVAMMQPITKWAHRVTNPHRIPDLVAQALRVATTGRPGPVYLELPADILFAAVEEERAVLPRIVRPEARPAPPVDAVDKAIGWLAGAQRPAILAGGGAWFSGSADELLRFAEATHIPVFANSKARGMVPDDHPLSGRGFMTLAATRAMGVAPDFVLLLGARLGLFTGGRGGGFIPQDAKVIQVDIAGEEIGRNRDIDLGIAADCRETLKALLAAAGERQWDGHDAWVKAVVQARGMGSLMFGDALKQDSPPIHPFRLAHDVAQTLERDAIIVADGGETASWMDMAAEVRGGGRWMSHGYLGCLGTGMPFAIAAQVAHPDHQVLCIIGDGSVGLNFAEFDTMVRHRLPVVTVVNNDQQWGMSAHGQELVYGRERMVATALGPTRYDLAAQGFGCYAELVERPEEIIPALKRSFASGKPACVNVMTDPTVIAPVTRAMVGGARPQDTAPGKVNMPYYGEREA